jgi:hypothetical protein
MTTATETTCVVGRLHPAPDCFTKAQRFFWEHAGYSFDARGCTTPEEHAAAEHKGHAESAMRLAEAEACYLDAHRKADVVCFWEVDVEGMNEREPDSDVELVEYVAINVRDSGTSDEGITLASLGGIEDATPEYRRVVRAELALECINELRQIAEQA